MCQAVDLSDSNQFVRSNYEEPNSNSRRRYYGDPDNVSRANQYYETAYTDGDRRTSQPDYSVRTGTGTKFTKPANQRKPLYSESRKAYAAALGYSNTRNGDSSETDSDMAGASSAEIGESNGSIILEGDLADNSEFDSVSASVKSNFPKQSQLLSKTDSCTCQGAANEEVSFICFSSRDGQNLSIKYKGTTMFDIEDIMKGYKIYFDSMQGHNVNIETIVNSESNFKQEFEGGNKLNFDISKFKINGGNFNAEGKFDINKIKKGDSKFKVTFDKFDVNTIKDGSNKFNIEITKNIKKYLNDKNFKTQFEKNINSNSKMEALKKLLEMAQSKTNNQLSLNNQFSYEANVQADAQADIEAHAKALAEVKAKAKAQAMFQAQVEAEAKAQAVLQNQIVAQAHVDAEAKARAKAKAKAEAEAKAQMQINGIGQTQVNSQSQSHTISFSDGNQGHLNNFVVGEKKIFGNGGFSLGFNGASNYGTGFTKQTGGAFSYSGGTGGAIGIGGGAGGAIGIGGGAGGAIGIGGGAGGALGIGGGAGGALGIGGGAGGAFGIGGGAGGAIGIGGGAGGGIGIGGGAGGAIGIGGGVGGAIGIGGRAPFTGKSMASGNDGMGTIITYSGSDFNYGDDMYDESVDDGSLAAGYSGVLAFPASSDGGQLYNNGGVQKDGYTAFGVSGYRYR